MIDFEEPQTNSAIQSSDSPRKPELSPENIQDVFATDYVALRVAHFKKLMLTVKALILEIVQYYLGNFYTFDDDAAYICLMIEKNKQEKSELKMIEHYKAFLEFLPIRLRSSIQGKNLFRQPTDLPSLGQFYENNLPMIQQFNQELFKVDAGGLTNADRLKVMKIQIEQELELSL